MQQYDPRNADIMVYVGKKLVHRNEARVSVFDSAVQAGDAVSETIRMYHGNLSFLDKHLRVLRESALALYFNDVPSPDEIKSAIYQTVSANEMRHNAFIRPKPKEVARPNRVASTARISMI